MYIIAEIGSNFTDLDDCLKSIDLAKNAGADAVKFQHFTSKEMHGSGDKVVTPEEWLPNLQRFAKGRNIDFSCTFFSPEKLKKYLNLLDFIKIASSNMMDTRLLDIAKESGKRTLISTGGHELFEVQRVYDYFPSASYLYCESVYPSYVNNYRKMRGFFFDGISDHSLDVFPEYPLCRYVEKHVNLVNTVDTPDAGHALDMWKFTNFCKHLKNASYRTTAPLLSTDEFEMRSLHNVRLVATKDIKVGDVLTWDNVGIYRGTKESGSYISPMDKDSAIGNVAINFIKAWSAIEARSIHAPQPEAESVRT